MPMEHLCIRLPRGCDGHLGVVEGTGERGWSSGETDHPHGVPPTLYFVCICLPFTIYCQFYRPALSCSALVTPPLPFTFSLVIYLSVDKLFPQQIANLVCGAQVSQPSASWGCSRLSDCSSSPPTLYSTFGHSCLILSSFPSCLHLLFTSPSSLTTDSLFFLRTCTSGS